MLSAGGTGGHLFPAFALAEELGRRGIIVDLVTDTRGDRYGMGFPARALHQVPSATMTGKSPTAIAKTAYTLSRGIAAAASLLGEVKPGLVLGFGGYPTFPPLLAAKMRGIKTAIHEQNAVLGRANRMVASRVDAIATSFERTKYLEGGLLEKVRLTGNPVRDVVLAAAETPYAPPQDGQPIAILVFGGSQGARFFSDAVPPAFALLPDEIKRRLTVVQQARQEDVERVEAAYAQAKIAASVSSFFPNLPDIMAEAHLVIGRAGASTIAELTVIGRPSILIPLPHALDDDQLLNATRLAESGGAWCAVQSDVTPELMAHEVAGLITDPDRLGDAARVAKSHGRPDAVARLADLVEDLIG